MKDLPPYTVIRKGRLFFQIGKKRAATSGLASSIPLGLDSKRARVGAWKLYAEYLEAAGTVEPRPASEWPPGSLGAWFDAYKNTEAWRRKGAATRADWEFAWQKIGDRFGKTHITQITGADVERFYVELESAKGDHYRWRHIRILRALFNAAVKHQVITSSPANTLPNSAPVGRSQIWYAWEVEKLKEAAQEIGRQSMWLSIWIGWETMLSPVDIRKLAPSHLRRDRHGPYLKRERSKTGVGFTCPITEELASAIENHIASYGVDMLPDAPFLRNFRDGRAYVKMTFVNDFALARKHAFGSAEKRQFRDIRRSANVEADIGGAQPEERAAALANAVDRDPTLDKTYTPETLSKARKAMSARVIGRTYLERESRNHADNLANLIEKAAEK